MNNSTEHLIASLSQDLAPVKPMASPGKRLLGWIALALPVSLVMGALVEQQSFALLMGERLSFALAFERLSNARSLVELGVILITALSAGYAALCCAQPGRSQNAWMLPVLPFITWLGLVGESCFQLFQQIGPELFSFAPHWSCYPSVLATGAAPAVVMVMLLKRGMLTSPTMTIALAALAASALGAVGLRLFHPPDATALLLMWQLIATVTFLGLASLLSAYMSRRIAV
ncbi:MAG: DUF1109 family protein [Magnetovibrio sp.]|nr:DUF1109 family protein [Magnetovibrio sp.]